jgi:primosomal protein N' (replication factor Y)
VEAERWATVEAGHQAIVMLNRRGYSPVMYCTGCGEAAKCPSCNVGLTYHKGRERLVCHYCGLSVPYPCLCATCGGAAHLPMGGGTERIEEYLGRVLPEGTGVLRMDRDSTRRQERLEDLLCEFSEGRAQVLVGTQMLSKGHHFPGVTLVVVADGDLGLNLPDYRAMERTFQLLVQVSGRAGRGGSAGRVLIQTRNPNHPIWADVLAADYQSFYDREIERRRRFGYPPFSRLGLVRLSHEADDAEAGALLPEATRIVREAAQAAGVAVLGPAPAPLARLRGKNRFHCLLKAQDWQAIRAVYARLWQWNPAPRALRLHLDLDPVNML